MKKRLRKKKHRGEFQEMGFHLTFRMRSNLAVEDRNQFLDRFWDEAIEGNGLMFGGGGGGEIWDGFVCRWPRGSATPEDRSKVEHWLIQEPLVVSYRLGDFVDAWYGPWPDEKRQGGWVQK